MGSGPNVADRFASLVEEQSFRTDLCCESESQKQSVERAGPGPAQIREVQK